MKVLERPTWRLYMAGKGAENLSDDAIVRIILAGNKDEYRILVERYKDQVYTLLRKKSIDHHSAEELAQEVFLRAFKALSRFRFDASFATWIIKITLNCANSWHTSAQRRSELLNVPLNSEIHPGASCEVNESSSLEKLQEAIQKLSPKLRDVILLCGLEGRSYDESAAILSIPVGTVRSRLNAARLALRQYIQESQEEEK